MPEANTIEVSIVGHTGSYVAAMKEAASTTDTAAKAIQAEVVGIGSSARSAHEPLSGFASVIKEYRSEIRQESRYSKFLAGDIASMGIASKGAAGEVTMLVSALAFSGPMGLAIEGVKILVKTIAEVGEEEKKQAEEVRRFSKDVAESVSESMKRVRESFEKRSATQTAWEAEGEKVRKKVRDIQEEINELTKHAGGFRDLMHSITTDYMSAASGMAGFTVEGIDDKIAKLQEKQKAIIDAYSSKKPEREATQEFEDTHIEEERAKKLNSTLLEMQAAMLEGEDQLRLQFEVKKAHIRDDDTKSEEQKNDEIFAGQMLLDEKVAKLKADRRAKEAADEKAFIDQITANEHADRKKRDAYEEHSKEFARHIQEELAADHLRLQKHIEKISVDGARHIAESFGGTFASMVTGAQSAEAAFASMAKSGIKAVIDMALKSIEAYVLSAEAAAAFSQAGIPIIGPALAMAAAAAMGAFISGLADQLPSAAVGADIPTSVDSQLVLAHGGESVLTHPTTDKLNEFLDGGGGGGDIHVHVHAAPGSYVDASGIQRLPHDQNFIRGMRDARRLGRWP